MQFIDTHTHLFVEQFEEDRNQVVEKALSEGVNQMLLPNIDLESIDAMHNLAESFPGKCIPMMGLHPCSVTQDWEQQMAVIKDHLFQNKYCAVGEIGVDLYWDQSTKEFQQKAFAQQIEWAKELKLPIVIHVRDAFDETFEIVDALNDDNLSGVFHCFTGTIEQAHHILNYGGFKLGIGGVLTFKNSGLDQVIEQIDLEHLVLETDSPYLAPTPFRGKRNESSYITYVASKLAEVKNVGIEKVAEITTQNAQSLFGL
ncbi:TatD family hydrolase [Paracrocinitomix mangrovi]|uniref:TatD family hydrolase n=1 Tax=Paracrocinitomix mangrovi TaxID=2862509 RepID=UPI001C8EB00D|nr:TatD family hydrolase [Paracrocinitomix mangrovi]UKN00692.1 TatD family hydrolase [Paracrocinitomix mangrovi]